MRMGRAFQREGAAAEKAPSPQVRGSDNCPSVTFVPDGLTGRN